MITVETYLRPWPEKPWVEMIDELVTFVGGPEKVSAYDNYVLVSTKEYALNFPKEGRDLPAYYYQKKWVGKGQYYVGLPKAGIRPDEIKKSPSGAPVTNAMGFWGVIRGLPASLDGIKQIVLQPAYDFKRGKPFYEVVEIRKEM